MNTLEQLPEALLHYVFVEWMSREMWWALHWAARMPAEYVNYYHIAALPVFVQSTSLFVESLMRASIPVQRLHRKDARNIFRWEQELAWAEAARISPVQLSECQLPTLRNDYPWIYHHAKEVDLSIEYGIVEPIPCVGHLSLREPQYISTHVWSHLRVLQLTLESGPRAIDLAWAPKLEGISIFGTGKHNVRGWPETLRWIELVSFGVRLDVSAPLHKLPRCSKIMICANEAWMKFIVTKQAPYLWYLNLTLVQSCVRCPTMPFPKLKWFWLGTEHAFPIDNWLRAMPTLQRLFFSTIPPDIPTYWPASLQFVQLGTRTVFGEQVFDRRLVEWVMTIPASCYVQVRARRPITYYRWDVAQKQLLQSNDYLSENSARSAAVYIPRVAGDI